MSLGPEASGQDIASGTPCEEVNCRRHNLAESRGDDRDRICRSANHDSQKVFLARRTILWKLRRASTKLASEAVQGLRRRSRQAAFRRTIELKHSSVHHAGWHCLQPPRLAGGAVPDQIILQSLAYKESTVERRLPDREVGAARNKPVTSSCHEITSSFLRSKCDFQSVTRGH